MSLDVLRDDFITPGALTTPPYTSISGSGFTSDGIKVYPNTVGGAECQSTLVQTFTITTTNFQINAEYELDVITPTPSSAWPQVAGQSWVAGMALVMPSTGRAGLTYTLKRLTTGPTSVIELHLRGAAAASDQLVTQVGIAALVEGQTYRLTAQIQFNAGFLGVTLLLDGVLKYLGAINLATWNLVTGLGTTSFLLAGKLPGLFTDIDGNQSDPAKKGFLDRLRLRDIGVGANQVDPVPAPTLTPAPNLTPITLSVENPATAQTLTVQPDYPMTPMDQWGGVSTVYDSGHVQTTATQTKRRIRWPMSWSNRNQTDRDTLMALHAATTGRVGPFNWTDPETGTVYLLRFTAPMQCRMVSRGGSSGGRIWSLSSEVEEVLSA